MARLSAGQIQSLWIGAGGAADKAALMSAIALAESNGITTAINPGIGAGGRRTNEYSVGLWQINTLAHRNYSIEQLKNPEINAREAVRIYREQGLRAWGAYTDGRYRSYIAAANAAASGGISPFAGTPLATGEMSATTKAVLMLGAVAVVFLITE